MTTTPNFVQFLESESLVAKSQPYLIPEPAIRSFASKIEQQGAAILPLSLDQVTTKDMVFQRMGEVLVIPPWCGPGWDSFDDAFPEILASWKFPLFVLVSGLKSILATNLHLALETVIRLSEVSDAFSKAGVQFVVVYAI